MTYIQEVTGSSPVSPTTAPQLKGDSACYLSALCVRIQRKRSMVDEPLEETVGRLLVQQGLTLSLAESCTGGLIGHRLTNVPGSSRYFVGSIVAYSYEAKEQALGVGHETLLQHGAVSEEVALEMAQGARRLFSTDVALGVTGIAGPGGGTPRKSVGLAFIALVAEGFERCEQHQWKGDRLKNKEQSAGTALRLLKRYLETKS